MTRKNILFLCLSLFGMILFLFEIVCAASYYADIAIDVDYDGSITIDGDTNYPNFRNIQNSQLFTSKEGEYWILNVSSMRIFDNYKYTVSLPKYSKINYIKTTQNLKIDEEDNKLKLIGQDSNKPFNLIVQYKIEKNAFLYSVNDVFIFSFFVIIVGFGLLLLGYVLYHKKLTNKQDINKNLNKKKIIHQTNKINFNKLTKRQKDIVIMLQKHKKLTQKQIQEKLQIPHSSVSRNLNSLQIKGIIKREKAGQSNYISLVED